MLTSARPNLFVIGAPRAGSSFLFSALGQHPDIFAPPVKEPHFYLADRWPLGGPEAQAFTAPLAEFKAGKRNSVWGGLMQDPADYAALYAPGQSRRWQLEGTPNYLAEGRDLAARIEKVSASDTCVIAVLRDPVARALSHHQLFVQNKWEPLAFEQAIAEADKRLAQGWAPTWDYLRYSQYETQLAGWRDVFGDRLQVVSFEDLTWNPQSVLDHLTAWLDLPRVALKSGTVFNQSVASDAVDHKQAARIIAQNGRLDVAAETAVFRAAARAEHIAPLVCVGMPVRNGAATIERALQSLQAQSYPNLQINVCDNASTDDTARIVARMAQDDPRIRLHRFDDLVDIHGSYTRALSTATGDYFMFAPSDDYWRAGFIAAAVGRLQADTNIAVCCGQIEVFDDAGKTETSAGVRMIRGSAGRRWQRALLKSADASRLYGVMRQRATVRLFPDTAPEGWDHYAAAKLALHGSIVTLDMVAMDRHATPRQDYQANVFRQEQTFWGRVFYARHVTRLFRDDPDINTGTPGAQAALLGYMLHQTALPLWQQRHWWLYKVFRRLAKLCRAVNAVAQPR